MVDADLHVLFANAALVESLGHVPSATTADLLVHAGFEVVQADGSPWPLDLRPIERAARDGVLTRRETMGLRRDGVVRWLRVSAMPIPGGEGESPRGAVAVYRDVTAYERGRQALVESEAHFRLLAENSTDVITRHLADGTCLYASPALFDVLGMVPAEMEGRQATDFVHPEDEARLVAAFVGLLRSGEILTIRYRIAHRNGRWVWVETVMRPVRIEGRVLELQSSTRDISARIDSEQRLARLALHDALTGLANRAALLQHCEDLLAADAPVAVLFLDLDRFKVVNDSLGHSAGDDLLRTVARRLAATCREGDVVSRLGGDEFVVVAPGLAEEDALQLAGRVQRVLAAPVELGAHQLVVSASVGIVVRPRGDERDAEALLRDADVSMYQAKAKGRARAVVWSEGSGERAEERLTLEEELRRALEVGEVVVHYQPQVELATGRVVGVEALARWAHPSRGLLGPAAFLGVAEETGLVVELGRQVLASAVHQVAAWRRLPGCEDLALSVNLSTYELLDPARLQVSLAVLAESALPSSALTLEVLESVLLDPEGAVAKALVSYAEHGVRLALDDFGTGSSSLLHLRHVPVSTVKVDREFVAGLGKSREDEAIVRALLSLTADLRMSCVAEGVEETGQREWLVDQGVLVAQGYLLHRPLPADTLEQLLRLGPQQSADE